MQEDCSLIAEIALWLWRLHTDCWDCSMIAEIAHWLLRLQRFRNLHIRLVIPPRVGEVAWELPQGNGTRMIEWVRMQELLSDCWYFALIAYWLLRLQSNCWDCCEIDILTLTLYHWDTCSMILTLFHWHCHWQCVTDTLILTLWHWHCEIEIVTLTLCYYDTCSMTLTLFHWHSDNALCQWH